jgi:hypothetical protein
MTAIQTSSDLSDFKKLGFRSVSFFKTSRMSFRLGFVITPRICVFIFVSDSVDFLTFIWRDVNTVSLYQKLLD